MSTEDRQANAADAASLYYDLGWAQDDIARHLSVSRPTVSRLLQSARAMGLVTITVQDPAKHKSHLEDQLLEKFSLTGAYVVPGPDVPALQLVKTARRAAALIGEVLSDEDVVGISWGSTMFAVGQALQARPLRGVKIVELKGGMPLHSLRTREYQTMTHFCAAFDATPIPLQVPILFKFQDTLESVRKEPAIFEAMEIGDQASVAIFTVGDVASSPLYLSDYLTDDEKTRIAASASGELLSRFVDADGQECSGEVADRTVSLGLDQLRRKRHRICVVSGREKAVALEAVLAGGYVSHLVTDELTASHVLARAAGRCTDEVAWRSEP